MNEHVLLASAFETHRGHLWQVAYRMLGASSEADDAVQEAWLRLNRVDARDIENMRAWLTTVVARVCLDMLRSRASSREDSLDTDVAEAMPSNTDENNPEQEVLLADAVGLAMLVMLDTLTPGERVAFVLHDVFAMPFDEIAPIVGRSPTAARKLASRARLRIQGTPVRDTDLARRREIVDAFLAASRSGYFDALMALLDPEVMLRADAAAVRAGALEEVRGAETVAKTFAGRARFAETALVDGDVAAVWAPGGQLRVVFYFTVTDAKIVKIELLAEPERLQRLKPIVLSHSQGTTGGSNERPGRR